jgi:hypothetical protein
MSGELRLLSLTRSKKFGRMITEVRLRDDARASDFRGPLPASKEAIKQGCTCPPQPQWPTVAFASNCKLHFLCAPPRKDVAQKPNNAPGRPLLHRGPI